VDEFTLKPMGLSLIEGYEFIAFSWLMLKLVNPLSCPS